MKFRTGAAEELSAIVEEAAVSKVVAGNLFPYLDNPDVVLNAIYKVLAENGELLFNCPLKSSQEQSIYYHMFKVLEEEFTEALGRKVDLMSLLTGFSGTAGKPYERADLEALANRNGFITKAYQVRPVVYVQRQMLAMMDSIIEGMKPELSTLFGEDITEKVAAGARKRFEGFSSQYTTKELTAEAQAYMYLRKVAPSTTP